MVKNSDQGKFDLTLTNYGTVKDEMKLEFNAMDGDKVTIIIPADERSFPSITRIERF